MTPSVPSATWYILGGELKHHRDYTDVKFVTHLVSVIEQAVASGMELDNYQQRMLKQAKERLEYATTH